MVGGDSETSLWFAYSLGILSKHDDARKTMFINLRKSKLKLYTELTR